MDSEAHGGWIRPPLQVQAATKSIVLLFSAQVTLSLFHRRYRSDGTKGQTPAPHRPGKPLNTSRLQEVLYSLEKLIKGAGKRVYR